MWFLFSFPQKEKNNKIYLPLKLTIVASFVGLKKKIQDLKTTNI